MTIISNGIRVTEIQFTSEKEYEDDVVLSSRLVRGNNSI